jgi:hypothetical protein
MRRAAFVPPLERGGVEAFVVEPGQEREHPTTQAVEPARSVEQLLRAERRQTGVGERLAQHLVDGLLGLLERALFLEDRERRRDAQLQPVLAQDARTQVVQCVDGGIR